MYAMDSLTTFKLAFYSYTQEKYRVKIEKCKQALMIKSIYTPDGPECRKVHLDYIIEYLWRSLLVSATCRAQNEVEHQ